MERIDNKQEKRSTRIAILDLNNGQPNQGMRCLRDIVKNYSKTTNINIELDEFEVRVLKQVPDLSYDVYISSGGPGSPLESEGSDWEKLYFDWLDKVQEWNNNEANLSKKYIFFICHSYQLACRYFRLATVCQRKSTAFGVFPIHKSPEAFSEPVFEGLPEPFFSVDSRDFQVIRPHHDVMEAMGSTILALEKERPHVPYERAIMAIRFNEYMIGTQFHPEADPVGMSMYLQREDRKQTVISGYGEEKWRNMIDQLNDPYKIRWTYSHLLPNFLNIATGSLVEA